jgi:ATP-dependent Lhr-like helicase
LPEALLAPAERPLRDLVLRYARTHAPFTTDELAARFALGRAVAQAALEGLVTEGKLHEGAFRPGGTHREYVHADVLRTIRQRSLAKLRKEIEPVEPSTFGRFCSLWHGTLRPRAGFDAILDAVEKLQGLPLPASVLESEILRARVIGYRPADLDALAVAGEILWCGVEPLGERDGRIALYLTDHFPRLWQPTSVELDERETRIVELLRSRGASFFADIHDALGGYPGNAVDALWGLVWKGVVTNDSFRALRAHVRGAVERPARRDAVRGFRSRRQSPRAGEGRWSLLAERVVAKVTATERSAALVDVLLQRYGVVTREVAAVEGIAGGFSAVYDVFKALEEAGRIRRGYFVSGVAAMQFAVPGVLEQLRALRRAPDAPEVVHLAATDPSNPYGSLLKWPATASGARSLARAAHALVILVDGALALYLTRGGRNVQAFLPENEPDRTQVARAIAARLKLLASAPERGGLAIAEIDGQPADHHPLAPHLREAGFLPSKQGYYLPRRARDPVVALVAPDDDGAAIDEASDA